MKTATRLKVLLSVIFAGLAITLLSSFTTYKDPIKPRIYFYENQQQVFINRLWRSIPPPPIFTTVDTVFSYGAGTWKATFRVPANLYAKNGVDSAQCIIFFPGAGEAGNGYGPSGLAKYGPLDYVATGWDQSVVLGNGTHYPIVIALEQIPDFPYNNTSRLATILNAINTRFRIKKKGVIPCIHLTGLSAGGSTCQYIAMSDPLSTTGPWPNASLFKSICNVQGVKPDDLSPYPTLMQNFARAGGRMASFEGSLDGRDMGTVINSMNAAVANSGIYTVLTGVMSTHCCWNWIYGGVGNGTTYTPAVLTFDGKTQNIYQWMLRQGDTTISGGGGNQPPAASAGPNQNLFYPAQVSTFLDGSASVDGDGTIASYLWTKLSGPAGGTIATPNASTTNITAIVPGTYVYNLLVTDNLGATGSANVTLNVAGAPFVNAGSNQTIAQPTSSITMAATATDENTVTRTLITKLSGPGQSIFSVCFMGSSTTVGYGVPADSNYVFFVKKDWKAQALIDTAYNIAQTSTNIYQGRPTGSPAVSGRDAPDPTLNINAACSKAGVKLVIVNYPTNGYDYMTPTEVCSCMREIQAYATSVGVKVWFTTSQPRSGFSSSEQLNLKTIADSIRLAFPTNYIDFYYCLITPGTTVRRPQFDLGDNVHNNGNGQYQLYKQVVGTNPAKSLVSSSSVITTPTSLTTTITSLGLGSHKFMVAAWDNDSLMSSNFMTVTVNPSSGITANAGADINITMPITSTQLNGTASSGSSLVYSWSKISGPAGSKAQEGSITNGNTATPTISDIGIGDYFYKLTLTSGASTSLDTVKVTGNKQKSRLPSALPPVKYSLTRNAGTDYYYTNITNDLPGLKGGDTIYLTQSAGTVQLYGAGADGGWGGDSLRPVYIRCAPGTVFSGSLRCDGQYINISGFNFQGTLKAGMSLDKKHSNIEVSNCFMTGGENLVYAKCPVDSLNVLTYGDNWRFNSDYFHDNYATQTHGEVFYVGHTFFFDQGQPTSGYIPIKHWNCTIYKDTCINAGWDGIQVSNGINFTISNCYVSGAGVDTVSGQAFGIIFGGYCTGRVDSNYVFNSWSAGITVFGYDTVRVRYNTVDSCGYRDVQTNGNVMTANPFTAIYANDNITPFIGPPSPPLVLKIQNNCIQRVSTYNGGAAVKNANGNSTTQPGFITTNTLRDALGRTVSNLIVSNVSGETISGNTFGSCNAGNINPIAIPGNDQLIYSPATSTTLVGSGTDVDGTIASYAWAFISGPNTPTITSPSSATTGLTGLIVGTYVLQLTVTDNLGASGAKQMSVTLQTAPSPHKGVLYYIIK